MIKEFVAEKKNDRPQYNIMSRLKCWFHARILASSAKEAEAFGSFDWFWPLIGPKPAFGTQNPLGKAASTR